MAQIVRSRGRGRVWVSLLLGGLVACSDNGPPLPSGLDPMASILPAQATAEQQLVRLVAAALADGAARAELQQAMVASRVAEQKLHVNAYLRGEGEPLLARMAGTQHRSDEQVLQLLRQVGRPLETYFPVPSHREQWRGGGDLIVAIQLDEGATPFGVDLEGRRVPLTLRHPPKRPTLMIVPAESFEASGTPLQRSLRPYRAGSPLRARTMDDCPPGAPGCDTGGGGGTAPPKTWQRGAGVDEYIEYMRTWNDHEPWSRGAPEFTLMLVGTTDGDSHAELSSALNITEGTWHGSDDDENADWNAYDPFSIHLAQWDVDYGTRVRVACIERDAPGSYSFDVSGNTKKGGTTVGFSASFEREGSDDLCGRAYITLRLSTGQWTQVPDNNPSNEDYDGTSDLQWYGYGRMPETN